jgi:hypothetical protein
MHQLQHHHMHWHDRTDASTADSRPHAGTDASTADSHSHAETNTGAASNAETNTGAADSRSHARTDTGSNASASDDNRRARCYDDHYARDTDDDHRSGARHHCRTGSAGAVQPGHQPLRAERQLRRGLGRTAAGRLLRLHVHLRDRLGWQHVQAVGPGEGV